MKENQVYLVVNYDKKNNYNNEAKLVSDVVEAALYLSRDHEVYLYPEMKKVTSFEVTPKT